MKRTSRLFFILAVSLICIPGTAADANARSNGLPSFLAGRYQQAFLNNRPLSLDIREFSTFYVTPSGLDSAEVRIGSTSAKPIVAAIRPDGSIFPDSTTACGLLDSYNFVSVVVHHAPDFIDGKTRWSTVVPIQFVDCSNASVPVTVSVERLVDDHLQLLVEGKIGGPIRYEGSPSSSHLRLEVRIQFVAGKLLECDGTALEDLDSVKGHSAWMLAAIPAPN